MCIIFDVFGLCSVSRALGIPCRIVTNFGSAHDSNGDLLMERFYNEFDENISDDSIWYVQCLTKKNKGLFTWTAIQSFDIFAQ